MTETPRTYPDKLEVKPLERPPVATVRVPGSKSITNRALIIAALACRQSVCLLTSALVSEDTVLMMAALRSLGFRVESHDETETSIRVRSPKPNLVIPAARADLF